MGGTCAKPSAATGASEPSHAHTHTHAGTPGASDDAAGKQSSAKAGSMTGRKSVVGTPSARRESERKGLRQQLVARRERVWDTYEIVREIGHGMTGKVYEVKNRITSEVFALKCMDLRRIDPELMDDLRNEIEVLRMMDHPHVIKLYEYFEDDKNIYLILEYCDGGELFDRLHQQAGSRYTESEAARLVFKMTAAVAYCHYMSISHRDLKLENFIFESKDPDSNIKLIDFGLSAKYGTGIRRMTSVVGTPYYLSPEVLMQSETGATGYTQACDCWSLGVITYMLLSGTPPFKGRRDREVLMAVRRGKYTLSGPKWEHISEEAKDFIRHLLVYNPAKRMTAEQALKHPWLRRAKHETETRPLDPEIVSNLRDFSKFSMFKRTALEAIAFSMSAQSIRHLREEFMKMDRDQTGFVSLAEFMDVVLANHLMSREEALAVFRGVDQDNTNSISYTEFLAASLSRRLWLSRERMRDAFVRLDVDGTGFITRENLKAILGDDWTPERVDLMMKEADAKGDGRIDFEEFLQVMGSATSAEVKTVMPITPASTAEATPVLSGISAASVPTPAAAAVRTTSASASPPLRATNGSVLPPMGPAAAAACVGPGRPLRAGSPELKVAGRSPHLTALAATAPLADAAPAHDASVPAAVAVSPPPLAQLREDSERLLTTCDVDASLLSEPAGHAGAPLAPDVSGRIAARSHASDSMLTSTTTGKRLSAHMKPVDAPPSYATLNRRTASALKDASERSIAASGGSVTPSLGHSTPTSERKLGAAAQHHLQTHAHVFEHSGPLTVNGHA